MGLIYIYTVHVSKQVEISGGILGFYWFGCGFFFFFGCMVFEGGGFGLSILQIYSLGAGHVSRLTAAEPQILQPARHGSCIRVRCLASTPVPETGLVHLRSDFP